MVDFTEETLRNIIKLSALECNEEELKSFASQLKEVLSYTSELTQVEPPANLPPSKQNINVFRDDRSGQCTPEKVLELAPEREDRFFVVPKIL